MKRARVGTIEDIASRGHRLRLWCFGCARSRDLDAAKVLALFVRRGWAIDLAAARLRFPCGQCRSVSDVLILPARSPPRPVPEPPSSWAREVEAFFHGNRSKRKDEPLTPAMKELVKSFPRARPKRRNPIDDLT